MSKEEIKKWAIVWIIYGLIMIIVFLKKYNIII